MHCCSSKITLKSFNIFMFTFSELFSADLLSLSFFLPFEFDTKMFYVSISGRDGLHQREVDLEWIGQREHEDEAGRVAARNGRNQQKVLNECYHSILYLYLSHFLSANVKFYYIGKCFTDFCILNSKFVYCYFFAFCYLYYPIFKLTIYLVYIGFEPTSLTGSRPTEQSSSDKLISSSVGCQHHFIWERSLKIYVFN